VSALLFSAVGGAGGEACVALAANLLFAVERLGEGGQGGVKHTATKAKHKVERRLLLDVVVAQRAAVLELLAGEDETLLIRGNALLILNLLLDIVNRVRRLHLEGDSLAREGLDEDLCVINDTFVVYEGWAG